MTPGTYGRVSQSLAESAPMTVQHQDSSTYICTYQYNTRPLQARTLASSSPRPQDPVAATVLGSSRTRSHRAVFLNLKDVQRFKLLQRETHEGIRSLNRTHVTLRGDYTSALKPLWRGCLQPPWCPVHHKRSEADSKSERSGQNCKGREIPVMLGPYLQLRLTSHSGKWSMSAA